MRGQRTYISIFGSFEEDWLEWLKWSQNVAHQLDLPIRYMDYTKKGREATGKIKKYSVRNLENAIQSNNLVEMTLYALPDPFKQAAFDWQLLLLRDKDEGHVFFGCEAEKCTLERMVEFLPSLLQFIQAQYGFGEYMPASDGPAFRSVGIEAGDAVSDMDGEELSRWWEDLNETRKFAQGFFRSVFNLNLLSAKHLSQPVGNSVLEAEILASKLPGKLLPIHSDIKLWWLQDEEIEYAKSVLAENALLIT